MTTPRWMPPKGKVKRITEAQYRNPGHPGCYLYSQRTVSNEAKLRYHARDAHKGVVDVGCAACRELSQE